MTHLTIETEDSFSSLLELAANNDLEAFKHSINRDPSAIHQIGYWYLRKKGSNQMVSEHRTPLMVAATYGSMEVLRFIISVSHADINRSCGEDKTTALHCAASGGSLNAVDAVKILLAAGADPNIVDGNGLRPADAIVVSPRFPDVKFALEELLGNGDSHHRNLRVSTSSMLNSGSPQLSSSPDENGSPSSDSTSSPVMGKFQDLPPTVTVSLSEKKEYPIDPSLPDIKNSIYATDEFRMFSFKIRPCSRAYSHDWTECPFVHPGENARRRDPRKFHYSCVPCPDFRKGACRRGDLCEYAHGVFECWLHPAQYRTRLCKDGTCCNRRVCFFAHTPEELRPLFMSTGSAVPSPRSAASAAAAMEMAMSLLPGSPSSMSMISPSPFTPPMSPSGGNGSPSSLAWPQPNVPTLHLMGGSLQSSRLRLSLNARDIPVEDYSISPRFETQQMLDDFSSISSNQGHLGPLPGSYQSRLKTLTPSNLDDLFCTEMSSSPRFSSDQTAVFSPTHKSALLNPFQQHQSLLSTINTSNVFSPKTVDPQQVPAPGHSSILQASFGISSPGRMSPRAVEPLSPMSSRMAGFGQRDKHNFRSLSSRELGCGSLGIIDSPVNSSWNKWGSPSGKLEWAVNNEELGHLRRSNSFEHITNGEEPDLSWVHSLVKEPSPDVKDGKSTMGVPTPVSSAVNGGENSSSKYDRMDQTVLGAWLEQMNLD